VEVTTMYGSRVESAAGVSGPRRTLRRNHLLLTGPSDQLDAGDARLRDWIAPGEQAVAVDLRSTETRCQGWEPDLRQLLGPWGPATGDPRRWRDPAQLEVALAAGGFVLVSGQSRDQRLELVVPVLRAAQRLRTWTGRPEWLIVSDVTELLGDPDVPPETLNLAEGGHILVLRDDVALPEVLMAACQVEQDRPHRLSAL
jgi:hypothetical protein